jgi:hypothetical protein
MKPKDYTRTIVLNIGHNEVRAHFQSWLNTRSTHENARTYFHVAVGCASMQRLSKVLSRMRADSMSTDLDLPYSSITYLFAGERYV